MQLLLDEHISLSLVAKCADRGIVAVPVGHRDLLNTHDPTIWRYAAEHDFVVVTTNARHFLPLLNTDLHPGLIVLREGSLTREEQWDRLERVLDYLAGTGEPPTTFMVNRAIEVEGQELLVREVPPP